MNNSVRNFSVIIQTTLENAAEKHDKASGKPYHTFTNQHLALSVKRMEYKEESMLHILRLLKRHILELAVL